MFSKDHPGSCAFSVHYLGTIKRVFIHQNVKQNVMFKSNRWREKCLGDLNLVVSTVPINCGYSQDHISSMISVLFKNMV